MLLTLLTLAYVCFLAILFHYQRRGKMYIGYTTVLSLLFLILLGLALISELTFNSRDGLLLCLILTVWVLGSVLIYLTSQLTLAFDKIRRLAQHMAFRDLERSERDHSD